MKSLRLEKPLNILIREDFVHQKLRNYVDTSGTRELRRRVEQFLKHKPNHGVHFKLDNKPNNIPPRNNPNVFKDEIQSLEESIHDESEEFLEILRLRHSNLSRIGSNSSKSQRNSKKILLITGDRGYGKTCLMASLYKQYVLDGGGGSGLTSESSSSGSFKNRTSSSSSSSNNQQFFLFYFLKSNDYLIDMIIDVTRKMRLRYLKKGMLLILKISFLNQKDF